MSERLFDSAQLTPMATVCLRGYSTDARIAVVEQQTPAWLAVRCGTVTASEFCKVVTTKGEPTKGQTRKTYMYQLIGERITGSSFMSHMTPAMERGTALEPQARAWYEMTTGRDVVQAGFIYQDDTRMCGGSPDGLCSPGGGLEIKCPLLHTHIGHLLKGGMPSCYIQQVQGSMWITGAEWWDFVLYTDEEKVPNRIVRIDRDAAMMTAFDTHIKAFCRELQAQTELIRAMGETPTTRTKEVMV